MINTIDTLTHTITTKATLIVGPAWVGDMVMAQSLFKIIKENDPSMMIDVVAPEWSQPLLDRMPEVRKAFTLAVGHKELNLKLRYQLATTLRTMNYTQAIVLPNSWKSALIPFWAKIPLRRGYLGEMRFGLINDLRLRNKFTLPRMVDQYVALAFSKSKSNPPRVNAPYPKLVTHQANIQSVLEKFNLQKPNHPVLALCPGAEFGASKRWPEAHFAEVARQKLKEGWSVWLLGSKKDMPVAENIQHQTRHACKDFTGNTSLGEAIDLLSLSTMIISNDSGLMHIAAALDKPLVALYGSTDPMFTPPLSDQSNILRISLACSPCFKRECPLKHHRCMQHLYPQEVLSAIKMRVP